VSWEWDLECLKFVCGTHLCRGTHSYPRADPNKLKWTHLVFKMGRVTEDALKQVDCFLLHIFTWTGFYFVVILMFESLVEVMDR
jgi:hypothetical protein